MNENIFLLTLYVFIYKNRNYKIKKLIHIKTTKIMKTYKKRLYNTRI